MNRFGKSSLLERETLCVELQGILDKAIELFDFTILEGFRNERDQNIAYAKGASKVPWPNGKHNKFPSDAVDVAPYPIDWSNKEEARQRFIYLAGYIMCIAELRGVKLRWGGDWNMNKDTRDEHFRDLGHFEVLRNSNTYYGSSNTTLTPE